jgi:hypothetical protein
MDEGWGNIIYLILLALFGIIGSLKKKKPVAVSPPDDDEIYEIPEVQNSNDESRFDSVLETLIGQELPKPYSEPYKYEKEILIDETEEVLDTVPLQEDPLKKSIEYTNEPKKKVFDPLSNLRKEEEINALEQEEIDWRKAIIYKEILERKYN